MEKINSYDELSLLISRHFGIGVITNCFISKEQFDNEIKEGSLFTRETDNCLLIYRKRKGFNILNFYVNSVTPDLPDIPKNTVCEIPYREKDTMLRGMITNFVNIGFGNMFRRIRMLRSIVNERSEKSSVCIANDKDFDSICKIYRESFNRITGCIPSENGIHDDIENGNYLVYRMNDNIAGFLHSQKNKNIYEIRHLAVDEKYRGQKIASWLVNDFTNINADSKIRVWVREDNLPAVRVYSKYGFENDSYLSDVIYKN